MRRHPGGSEFPAARGDRRTPHRLRKGVPARVQGRGAGEAEGIRPSPWATPCYSLPFEPAICRRCARCRGVLRVTPQDELVCPRCGRVRAWTVSLSDLGDILEDLRRGQALRDARDRIVGSRGPIEAPARDRRHPRSVGQRGDE